MKSIFYIIIVLSAFNLNAQGNWWLVEKEKLDEVPYSLVLKIQSVASDTSLGGTGFFVSDTCVITNRHLVWNSDMQMIHEKILVSAGFIGYDKAPLFGSVLVELKLDSNLFLPDDHLKSENDFAMIKLPNNWLYQQVDPTGTKVLMNLSPFSEDNLNKNEINITGFTGWKKTSKKKPRGRMYNSRATFVKRLDNGEMQYKASSVRGGNSGSPIWILIQSEYHIIGIHRRGASAIPEMFGKRHGVYWTQEKINLINRWQNSLSGVN